MTPKEAMDVLKEKYERAHAALAKLPKGAEVIDAMLTLSDTTDDYIQLFQDGELPAGPVATRRGARGSMEKSVQIAGVKVIWLDWEEAKT